MVILATLKNILMISGTHARPPSVREQLASGAAAVVVVPSPQPGCPRSLLGRLGIRKPSLLSLTSPHGYNSHPTAATARTFSLDDLLKPPPRSKTSPLLWQCAVYCALTMLALPIPGVTYLSENLALCVVILHFCP